MVGEVVVLGGGVVVVGVDGETVPRGGVPGVVVLGDVVELGGVVVLGDVIVPGEVVLGEVLLGEFPVGTQGVTVVLDDGLVELVVVPGEVVVPGVAELLLEGLVELEELVDELDWLPVLLPGEVDVPVLLGEVPGGHGLLVIPV
ncbi:MAG TPA: hypothetical protein VHA33_20635 [Candidatus Angelobacter sp.]|nr:hypothetical protein [Candidatus Angelobacter sp.]